MNLLGSIKIRTTRQSVAIVKLLPCLTRFGVSMEHPNDPKYRKIKKNNPAFQKRLHNVPGSIDVLTAIGFTETEENGETMLQLQATKEGWELLVDAKKKVEQEIEALQPAQPTPSQSQPSMGAGMFPNMNRGFGGLGMGMGQGAGGVGGGGGTGGSWEDQMQDAAMSAMMSNPDFIRSMMDSPMFRQMSQNNPMFETMLNQMRDNPQMFQQSKLFI